MGFGIDGVDLILSVCSPNNNVILCGVCLRLDVNTERRFVTTRKICSLFRSNQEYGQPCCCRGDNLYLPQIVQTGPGVHPTSYSVDYILLSQG